MEQKIAAALARCAKDREAGVPVNVTALCAELGFSRPTFYKYEQRFREGGLARLLAPPDRRPLSSPSQIPAAVEDEIVRLRKELIDKGWDAGAITIREHLRRMFESDPHWAGVRVPAVSTVHRVLRRNGLVVDQPEKRPKSAGLQRFVYPNPNALWATDAFDWSLADGTKVVILQVLDDHSRLLLSQLAAAGETTSAVWQALQVAIDRHGLPMKVLTDRGAAMLGWPAIRTQIRKNLEALGVQCVTTRGDHPQCNGKNEAAHKPLQKWLRARPSASSLAELQTLIDEFEVAYNSWRPHQGIGLRTPAEQYAASPKLGPGAEIGPEPLRTALNKVNSRGVVSLLGPYQGHVGRQWEGCQITVMRTGLEVSLFYGDEHLLDLTIDPSRRYQSTGQINTTSRRRKRVRIKTIGTCQ
ncbi:MAG: integrase core domain-containing protein [Gemmatimonadaceae bacterium]